MNGYSPLPDCSRFEADALTSQNFSYPLDSKKLRTALNGQSATKSANSVWSDSLA